MPSNHLILCRPLLLPPSISPSIRVFSNELALYIRWPEYWSFNISPSSEYSRLISFRMGWLDLLTVQGTLKSLLQHHSSKASILRCAAFSMVQLSWIVWRGPMGMNPSVSPGAALFSTSEVSAWSEGRTCAVCATSGSSLGHLQEMTLTYISLWLHQPQKSE